MSRVTAGVEHLHLRIKVLLEHIALELFLCLFFSKMILTFLFPAAALNKVPKTWWLKQQRLVLSWLVPEAKSPKSVSRGGNQHVGGTTLCGEESAPLLSQLLVACLHALP